MTTTHSLQAIKTNPSLSLGDPLSARDPRLAPEEVYSKRSKAPSRYEEFDPYFAYGTERLSAHHKELPDSDMLKSIHAYTSRFYEAKAAERDKERIAAGKVPRSFKGGRLVDERSMNETALLAMGILLEEAGRELLGTKGDLVFVESAREEEKCFGKDMETRYADEPVPVVPRPVTNPFVEPGLAASRATPVRPAVVRAASSAPRDRIRDSAASQSPPGSRGMSASTTASHTRSRHSRTPTMGQGDSMGDGDNQSTPKRQRQKRSRMSGDAEPDEPLDETQSYQFRRHYPKQTRKRKLSHGEASASDGA